MFGRRSRRRIPKVKAKDDIVVKSLKLRVNAGAFCVIGILLKFDYSASKVESFVAEKSEKRRSQIGMVRRF